MTTSELIAHPVSWMRLLHEKPEEHWIRRGETFSINLVKQAAKKVPAYASVLAKSKKRILRSFSRDAFRTLPILTKDNYLRAFPLPELFWNGALKQSQTTIAATSGSTGVPFYFPRTRTQDLQYAAVAEMYLRSNFSIHKKPTLYIVGWGMGVWIGGVFSYEAVRIVAERGKYPLSVITPGTSSEEILKAVKNLGPLFDQVIIGGYPPMIKDLIDQGNTLGVKWDSYNCKFIFSAEGFSEAFRDYVITQAHLKNPYTDTLNHYGTVDMGTMAHETPVSILIRRLALSKPELNEALFGKWYRQPTLAQYIPELFFFEENDGKLVCTADSGLPLVRYDLLDTGGVKTFGEVTNIMARFGIDLTNEIKSAGISDTVWNLPFVYVFERSDFTVKLSGANIFPEEVRRVLEQAAFESLLTGRCTMEIGLDTRMDQFLVVHVEMKKGVSGSAVLEKMVCDKLITELRKNNSEYAYLYNNLPLERMTPRIHLWEYQSMPHFTHAGKHQWVTKRPV